MAPENAAALIVFLFFLAPGVVYDLELSRIRPRPDDTVFREANRIVLTSVVAAILAGGLVLVPRAWSSKWLNPVLTSLETGGDEWRNHIGTLLTAGAAAFLLAILAAWGMAKFVASRRPTGEIHHESPWFGVFREFRPAGSHAHVVAVCDDGTRFFGRMVMYTPDAVPPEERDLVLGGRLFMQGKGDSDPIPLEEVSRVVLSGSQVSRLLVTYVLQQASVRKSAVGRPFDGKVGHGGD